MVLDKMSNILISSKKKMDFDISFEGFHVFLVDWKFKFSVCPRWWNMGRCQLSSLCWLHQCCTSVNRLSGLLETLQVKCLTLFINWYQRMLYYTVYIKGSTDSIKSTTISLWLAVQTPQNVTSWQVMVQLIETSWLSATSSQPYWPASPQIHQ